MARIYKCDAPSNERTTRRATPGWRNRAPRTIRLEDGADATAFEDLPSAGFSESMTYLLRR
jgi:hypothetical protein